MVSRISKNDKNFAPLTDRQIYIVGPRRFQNELMVYFLERETGAKCLAKEEIRHFSTIDDKTIGPQRQVLLDCLGKDLERVLAEIESHGKRVLAQDLVAFFNVGPGLGIEERTAVLGVRGFFYEHDPLELFLKGVHAIFRGELWLSRGIMTKCIVDKGQSISSKGDSIFLTQREIEILAMVAVGATNEEIADKLFISPHTVKTHIYNIFKKIDVSNRLQAALWAAKNL